MAVNSEVRQSCPRGHMQRAFAKLALACALLFCVMPMTVAYGAESSPVLGESNWRTGELEVCYSNVTVGHTLILYVATYETPNDFTARDAWIAPTSQGCYVTKFYENGQTIWHYLVSVNPVTGEESAPSNEGRQTPPITAYIINWPDMLSDLMSGISDAINNANQNLMDHLDGLFTPSQGAMDNLKDAVDSLKNATGASTANDVGNNLQDSLNDVKTGLKPPVTSNDGVGTFTGGAHPMQLPDLEGTHNEMTWCVPLTHKMDGTPFNVCIFTNEQMEKMKWWQVARDLIGYTVFITFAFWIVTRFTPSFKV